MLKIEKFICWQCIISYNCHGMCHSAILFSKRKIRNAVLKNEIAVQVFNARFMVTCYFLQQMYKVRGYSEQLSPAPKQENCASQQKRRESNTHRWY